jgi:type VI secretion system protein ImpB
MPESIQHKLDRVRKPRVHITYDVEVGDAVVLKELPFVVGVLGDFSGNPTEPLKRLDERKFVSIDRDNFNDVMTRMTPGLNLKVENTLKGDGSEMGVQLKFRSMEDFEPGRIVEQVEPLRKLMETRNKLRDLLTNADKAARLEPELEEILQNTEKLRQLAAEMGASETDSTEQPGGGTKE